MKELSFYKKFLMYREYKKIIKSKSSELSTTYNIRKDFANRLYTVLNIPTEQFEEPLQFKNQDINKISEKYIKEFSVSLSKFLDENGLKELYRRYDIKKVDKYSYLLVYGFSLFDTTRFNRNLYYYILPLITITSLIAYFIYR